MFIYTADDEKKIRSGGYNVNLKKSWVGGEATPGSTTLHHNELAIPTSLFFIPQSLGGRSKNYEEELDKDYDTVDDDLYDKLLRNAEFTKINKKETRKHKLGDKLHVVKKTKKVKKSIKQV